MEQREGEDLEAYYQRTEHMLKAIGKDQNAENEEDTEDLTVSQRYSHLVVRKWVEGLQNARLRLTMIEYLYEPKQSLSGALAEAQACIEIFKEQDEWKAELELERDFESIRPIYRQYLQAYNGDGQLALRVMIAEMTLPHLPAI